MLPDRISNPGPLTYESGALPMLHTCISKNGSILCYSAMILRKLLTKRGNSDWKYAFLFLFVIENLTY